ncbi:MAG TPA: hypothetical protein VGI77_02995 [Gaiellaceae bacterium]|jgi:hypothetical protein
MDDATAEKIGRNNAVFREANGEIATAAIEHGLDHGTPFPGAIAAELAREQSTE